LLIANLRCPLAGACVRTFPGVGTTETLIGFKN
jgi:hypothetical protein